ncbi:MAG: glycosyltransferase family 2 protein [Pirellulaceae bacterium]
MSPESIPQNVKPLFSVIVPLHDDRGVALKAIQGWLGQKTETVPFEIVVVDSGRPKLARQAAKLLGPGDHLVREPSANEALLYNAGAKAATADWLVFSESHVVPCAGAAAALCHRLLDPDCDAAVLGSVHGIRSRFAAVDAELCNRESSAMRGLGLWRAVGLRGFAIRRETFNSLGRFTEEYFRFAETALAIRLVESGHQLEEFPDVALEHFDTDGPRELLSAMAIGRLGACRFWAAEPKLAANYFGCPAPRGGPGIVDPTRARQVWQKLLRALLGLDFKSVSKLAPLAGPKLFAALFAWRGQEWKARWRAWGASLRFLTMLHLTHRRRAIADCQPLLDQYLHLRECCADIGSVWFRAETPRDLPIFAEVPSSVNAESLPDCGINFFPPEVWQGESYCWSAPQAAIMLPKVWPDCCVRLDARPTGGWLARRPRLFLDGRHIGAECVTETGGIVEVIIPAEMGPAEENAVLSWECDPFVPADSGLADQRKLGVALIRATVEQSVAAATSKTWERAA